MPWKHRIQKRKLSDLSVSLLQNQENKILNLCINCWRWSKRVLNLVERLQQAIQRRRVSIVNGGQRLLQILTSKSFWNGTSVGVKVLLDQLINLRVHLKREIRDFTITSVVRTAEKLIATLTVWVGHWVEYGLTLIMVDENWQSDAKRSSLPLET